MSANTFDVIEKRKRIIIFQAWQALDLQAIF